MSARAAVLALCTLLAMATPGVARAQAFIMPSTCTSGATGSDDDLPPVVLVGDGKGGVPLNGLWQDTQKQWWVNFTVTNSSNTYLLLVTYTPFLQSYEATQFMDEGARWVLLPRPGVYTNKQYHLYSTVTLTVMTTATGNTPMPGAFVEMAPDFDGSSPYALQADQHGRIVVNCFTALPGGNAATVYKADHSYAYDVTWNITPSKASPRTAIATPRPLAPAVTAPAPSPFRLP